MNIPELTRKELDFLPALTPEEYSEWRDRQPDSPVPASLRLLVRGLYDLQGLRIRMGNQCFAQFRAKLGLASSDKEADDKAAAKVIDQLREHYKKITTGAAEALGVRQFHADGVFADYAEYQMVASFMALHKREEAGFTALKHELKRIPIYTEFLLPIGGVGPALSGFMLCELNPYRARHASSFWKFFGLDVGPDGAGRCKREGHMEERWTRVVSGEGYKMKKTKLKTHNPTAKAKVAGVLPDCLIKAGLRWNAAGDDEYNETPEAFRCIDIEKGKEVKYTATLANPYIEAYLNYKHRKANSIAMCKVWRTLPGGGTGLTEVRWCDTSPAHRERAAKRYMVKLFLADFWKAWRKLEGLEVGLSYAEKFLGHNAHGKERREA